MSDASRAEVEAGLDRVLEAIRCQDRFVITSHVVPDGDCVSSLLAFRRLLMGLGKTCWITYTYPVPGKYAFLADIAAISNEGPDFAPGVLAVLDAGNQERVAVERALLESVLQVINVDHHASNTGFGTCAFVDAEACATCALIYRMYEKLGVPVDADAASQLFCGIMTDTGRLSFSNANAEAFAICAELVRKGAKPDRIAREVYFQEEFSLAKARGRVLSTLELSAGGKICSMVMSRDAAGRGKRGSADEGDVDTEGLVDYALRVRGAQLGILVKWAGKDMVKVSLRSAGAVDVNELAKVFGGGGHRSAAGCTLAGEVGEVKSRVLAEAERWLRR